MKHFFLRDKYKKPVGCVVSQRFVNNHMDYVIFAVSAHNPLDRFSRKDAFVEAVRNFEKNGVILPTRRGIKIDIMNTIIEHPVLFPQRTRDAAKLWVKEHFKPVMAVSDKNV